MTQSVLITGASSGIGYELARCFAKHHDTLIIACRSKEKMQVQQQLLEKEFGCKVIPIPIDLGEAGSGALLYKEVKALGFQVDILVNNAGAGYVGEFCEKDVAVDEQIMALNMMSLTVLTKHFAKEMKERGQGKILNVASTGAYHPGPYTAVYYGTKAYVLSLSEALHRELKPYGVTVSALCPGATKTNFAKSAGKEDTKIAMSPVFVAQEAYKGLVKNKRVIVPGIQNRLFIKLPRHLASFFVGRYQSKLKQ